MAITPIEQWDPTALPIRPGLYTNFKNAAIAQITGGARGTVAIPLISYKGGSATAKKMYTVEGEAHAQELFGAANIQSIKFVLQGGAKKVLIYTMPEAPEQADYTEMRDAFEAHQFNVFVYDGEVGAEEQAATLTWLTRNRTEKKHFMFVTGGSAEDDQDIAAGNARSVLLADDYVVNLVAGVVIGEKSYSSGQYAAYLAGLVAGTAINKSITYKQVRVNDVTKRLRNSEIESALKAGSLVLVHDGEKVIVEQGLVTSGDKIRKIRGKQAIATDVEKTARDNYIGKIDNNEAGQMSLLSAIKAYLETLQVENVLINPQVALSTQYKSEGDKVFVDIAYTEVDSMERIFLTITTA
ncbi:phage tail sheath subtilisin-like domain-containing protein [Brevibacillus daliensis]|uniref:phage tail sheath subtilisin-like domain-containing protein n=1 Tax=Brevibacillus daliensis TaxID=2892995 RepID=UPI001E5348D0|nr:phage tail sheath subtilisin-like domain-containing protein [Brevibacillus daliensis]